MRRFLAAFSVWSLLLVLLAFTASWGGERPKIIVGGDHDNPPYEFLENGRPTGFNVDLMRAVADAGGVEVEFRLGPWNDVRRELEQGKIDALAGMYYSEERSKAVDFSVPHTMVSAGLFVRGDSQIRSMEDIKGKEVIVQKGDVIDDYLREKGITSRIIEVKDPADELRLLDSGRHDSALMPSRYQGEYLKQTLGISNVRGISVNLPQLRYCFAVKKGNDPLRFRLDEGLNILKVNGKYQEIYNKWFGVYEQRKLWRTVRYFVWSLAIIAGLLAASSVWSWILRREVRKRTSELRESEEKFRVLAETSPAAIIVYQEEKNVYINPYATQLIGYTEREFLEMNFWDWMHPDSKELVRERGFARQRGEQVPSRYEIKYLTKNGEEKWIFVSAGRIEYKGKPAGIATMFDITDRKRMEEELQQAHDELEKRVEDRTLALRNAKEEWERTFASVPDLIAILDDQYRVLRVNEAMAKRLGLKPDECVGLHCYEAIHGLSEAPPFCPHMQTLMDGRKHVVEVHEERLGGDFLVSTIPLNDERGVMIGSVHIAYDITERKRAEEALRESEQRYRTVADYTYDWEYWIAPDGSLNYVSPSCKRISGYSAEEFIANPGILTKIIHPEDRPLFERHLLDVSNGEVSPGSHEEDFRIIRRDGSERWVAHDCQQVFAADGRYIGRRASNRDITDRKLADEALRESESAVRQKLVSILDPEGDIGELDLADIIDAPEIQALMDDLYRNTGLKMSIIDHKGRVLVDVGWQDICLKFHRIHPETLKKCLESDTLMTEGIPPGEFRTYRCKNNIWHIVTPIFVGGRHMGNLFMGQFFFENEELDYDLFRAQARQHGFPEEEYMAALEAVPRRSEECVDKGKAFFLRLIDMFSRLSYGNIKLARLLAERDRLTETLRESEARLKLAMDLAKLGAWEYDVSTGLFSFDDQFYALYGTTAEREGGTLMSAEVYARKFIPPEESAVVANGIEEVQANSYIQLEHRIIRTDGEERFIVVRGEAVFDQQGGFVKIRGANQDITERKRAEEELRESRAKYQAIVDNFEGLIYICSQDYRVEFMNRKLIERTGYDATGEFCYRMMHDRDSVCPWCVNERVFAGETFQWEMFSPKDNHWYYVVNVPIPHADGTISKQSMMLDITYRKQAEEDLRKANMVVENSPVVLFRCKAAPGWPVELVSKNVIQFGYTPEEFLSGELTYSSIVYSRDLGKLTAETEEYSATGKGKWLQEYRIVTKEGDIRWIIDETVCERNEEGEITYYEGVIIDVTERRKAEEQLLLQQMQLRDLNRTLEVRVQEEVAKNREKDIILIQQNRQAALGELFDHIAHQWKQPLNSIAVIIQALGSTCTYEQVTNEYIVETVDSVMDMVGHMAQTVEVFRNFYKPDKEKSLFLVKDSIDKALTFVTPVFRRYGIEVDLDADAQLLAFGYPKEYAQVLLNLLGNAKDALTERKIENPRINIKAFADGEYAVVTITDNAGGVPDESVGRIFDLYFTTKESSGGTGIGLYMSRNIVEKNMGGKLTASNIDNGAQFRIELGKS